MTPTSLPRHLVRLFTRHYPLMSGCGTLANTSPFKVLSKLGDADATAKLQGGAQIEVRLDDYVGRALFFFGDLDPKVSAVVRRVLQPGDSVLDIGANIGVVTMIAAGCVGTSGSVHSFEPQPDLCRMVERSAALNGYSQVHTHEVALSDHDYETDFFVPEANRGTASLSRANTGPGQTFHVHCKQAGEYLKATGLQSVRLLKIDVEGHEDVVLNAAAPFLDSCRPDVVLFESNEQGDFWSRGPVQWLHTRGYELYEIHRSRVRLRLGALMPGMSPEATSNDFVAVSTTPSRRVNL